MKLSLPNGITIEGKDELELSKAATALGYGYLAPTRDASIWHYSESKGIWVRIVEMDTNWLKNTVLKLMREHVDEVAKASSPRTMVQMILTNNNTHLAAVLRELNSRRIW